MTIQEDLAIFCEKHLDLENAVLGEEYYYQSLPLCVIDAVYSIGAHYSSTRNVVVRFCKKFNLQRIRDAKNELPKTSEQLSTSSFLNIISGYSPVELAKNVFENNQRTSAQNGILKAEAVVRFAKVLQQFDGEYFQSRSKFVGNKNFKNEIRKIPGQRSGISTRYFYMLAGSDDFIKPDRMISRFIEERTGKRLSLKESQELIIETQKLLSKKYENLTPKLLDFLIWNFQSGRT